jgi:hypothetical protein
MAHATPRQLETTLPTRPVPEPSEQQRAAVVAQLAEFVRDGYLYLPQVLAKTHVENWADRFASNGFFQSIFDDLYQRGHVSIPTHCSVLAPYDCYSNSDQPRRIQGIRNHVRFGSGDQTRLSRNCHAQSWSVQNITAQRR